MALTTVPASLSATAITLTTAAQPNITSVGTLTGLTVSGNIAGTLTTAAQTNITSVGTLTGLTVSGGLAVDTTTFNVDNTNNRVGIGTATPQRLLTLFKEIHGSSYSGDEKMIAKASAVLLPSLLKIDRLFDEAILKGDFRSVTEINNKMETLILFSET